MLNFSSLSITKSRDSSSQSVNVGSVPMDDEPPAASSSSSKSFSILPSKDRPRALSLTRSRSRDETKQDRGRDKEETRSGRSRTRSTSPFHRRKVSMRDPSPAVEALRQSQSDAELSEVEEGTSMPTTKKRRSWTKMYPRRSAFADDSASSSSSSDGETDDDESGGSDDETDVKTPGDPDYNASTASLGTFDQLTEANTEANAMMAFDEQGELIYGNDLDDAEMDLNDPTGEGVNVIRAEEPMFGPHPVNKDGGLTTGYGLSPASNPGIRQTPKRKETIGRSTRLPLDTSRPFFSRDRCTVTLTHGDPAKAVKESHREPKKYIVASDLSIESGYAVEWGIGTVLRDGDTMILVSVQETDTKLDPDPSAPPADRVSRLRNQQERQALSYLLVRQVTALLQRTKLHCTIICMAVHAKNSRRLLLDLIDYIEPTMVIVGSRGRGELKGILLGSTSHYLIQKSSVPVMVARRRLRRPARRTAHLQVQRPQPGSTYLSSGKSKLTEALIDKAGPGKVDADVEHMREEMEREETEEVNSRRSGGSAVKEAVGSLGVQGGVGGGIE